MDRNPEDHGLKKSTVADSSITSSRRSTKSGGNSGSITLKSQRWTIYATDAHNFADNIEELRATFSQEYLERVRDVPTHPYDPEKDVFFVKDEHGQVICPFPNCPWLNQPHRGQSFVPHFEKLHKANMPFQFIIKFRTQTAEDKARGNIERQERWRRQRAMDLCINAANAQPQHQMVIDGKRYFYVARCKMRNRKGLCLDEFIQQHERLCFCVEHSIESPEDLKHKNGVNGSTPAFKLSLHQLVAARNITTQELISWVGPDATNIPAPHIGERVHLDTKVYLFNKYVGGEEPIGLNIPLAQLGEQANVCFAKVLSGLSSFIAVMATRNVNKGEKFLMERDRRILRSPDVYPMPDGDEESNYLARYCLDDETFENVSSPDVQMLYDNVERQRHIANLSMAAGEQDTRFLQTQSSRMSIQTNQPMLTEPIIQEDHEDTQESMEATDLQQNQHILSDGVRVPLQFGYGESMRQQPMQRDPIREPQQKVNRSSITHSSIFSYDPTVPQLSMDSITIPEADLKPNQLILASSSRSATNAAEETNPFDGVDMAALYAYDKNRTAEVTARERTLYNMNNDFDPDNGQLARVRTMRQLARTGGLTLSCLQRMLPPIKITSIKRLHEQLAWKDEVEIGDYDLLDDLSPFQHSKYENILNAYTGTALLEKLMEIRERERAELGLPPLAEAIREDLAAAVTNVLKLRIERRLAIPYDLRPREQRHIGYRIENNKIVPSDREEDSELGDSSIIHGEPTLDYEDDRVATVSQRALARYERNAAQVPSPLLAQARGVFTAQEIQLLHNTNEREEAIERENFQQGMEEDIQVQHGVAALHNDDLRRDFMEEHVGWRNRRETDELPLPLHVQRQFSVNARGVTEPYITELPSPDKHPMDDCREAKFGPEISETRLAMLYGYRLSPDPVAVSTDPPALTLQEALSHYPRIIKYYNYYCTRPVNNAYDHARGCPQDSNRWRRLKLAIDCAFWEAAFIGILRERYTPYMLRQEQFANGCIHPRFAAPILRKGGRVEFIEACMPLLIEEPVRDFSYDECRLALDPRIYEVRQVDYDNVSHRGSASSFLRAVMVTQHSREFSDTQLYTLARHLLRTICEKRISESDYLEGYQARVALAAHLNARPICKRQLLHCCNDMVLMSMALQQKIDLKILMTTAIMECMDGTLLDSPWLIPLLAAALPNPVVVFEDTNEDWNRHEVYCYPWRYSTDVALTPIVIGFNGVYHALIPARTPPIVLPPEHNDYNFADFVFRHYPKALTYSLLHIMHNMNTRRTKAYYSPNYVVPFVSVLPRIPNRNQFADVNASIALYNTVHRNARQDNLNLAKIAVMRQYNDIAPTYTLLSCLGKICHNCLVFPYEPNTHHEILEVITYTLFMLAHDAYPHRTGIIPDSMVTHALYHAFHNFSTEQRIQYIERTLHEDDVIRLSRHATLDRDYDSIEGFQLIALAVWTNVRLAPDGNFDVITYFIVLQIFAALYGFGAIIPAVTSDGVSISRLTTSNIRPMNDVQLVERIVLNPFLYRTSHATLMEQQWQRFTRARIIIIVHDPLQNTYHWCCHDLLSSRAKNLRPALRQPCEQCFDRYWLPPFHIENGDVDALDNVQDI